MNKIRELLLRTFSFFEKITDIKPKTQHVWQEYKRVNLGSFTDYGNDPLDNVTMYRIGVYEKCLYTNRYRIREVQSLYPVEE